MRSDLTKPQRRRIRELAGIAHDRELAMALTALDGEFARWRSGAISVCELSDSIHEFHRGPHRDLYTRYTLGDPELAVAAAIAGGCPESRST
jgi:hypothetical protein